MKTKSIQKLRSFVSRSARKHGLAALAAALPLGAAQSLRAADAPAPSRVNTVLNFEFSDKYLTPRGMIVHQNGLTFQQLALGLFNVYKGDSGITDVTLVGGVWNDFSTDGVSSHAPFGSKPTTAWVEIDPIAGVSLGLGKQFTLSATYTAFNMQILDIGVSQHLETKLAFDDSPYLKAFAVHPYFLYWQELDGKATAADVPYIVFAKQPGPGSSHYFEVGVTPSHTFENISLTLEAPTRVLLPDKDFYGEYYGKSSVVGLWETGLKATLPMKFMPEGYGHWSYHAGFKYMGFEDKSLKGMQQFNAPGQAVSGSWQLFAGIKVFF